MCSTSTVIVSELVRAVDSLLASSMLKYAKLKCYQVSANPYNSIISILWTIFFYKN